MMLKNLVETIQGSLINSRDLQQEITQAYCADILSDVMAFAGRGYVWITIQTHVNIIAVARLKKLGAIILAGSNQPQPDTVLRSREKGVTLITTNLSAFEVAGLLYQAGLRN